MKTSRSKLVLEAQLWNLLTPREKTIILPMGKDFEYDLFKILNKNNQKQSGYK